MPINSSNCKMSLSIVVLISRWIFTQIWMKSNTSPMTVILELCRYFLFFFEYCCNLRQQIRFFLLNEKKPRTHSQAFPVWLGSILTQPMITFFSGLVAVSFNLFSPYIATFSGRLFRSRKLIINKCTNRYEQRSEWIQALNVRCSVSSISLYIHIMNLWLSMCILNYW